MDKYNNLQEIFQTYLGNLPDVEKSKKLSYALSDVDLIDQANAIELYSQKNASEVIYRWQSGVWNDTRCFVSAHMPTAGQPGDLWFDVVELTAHVLVPHLPHYSKDVTAWLAIHPIWMWQFKAFLNVAKWRSINSLLINVTDLLDSDRFRDISNNRFADNLYHEEALAYSQWFGKSIGDVALWQSAQAFLDQSQFNEVLPGNFKLWAGNMSFDKYLRDAYGVISLDISIADQLAEFKALDTQMGLILPDRTIFGEFERQPQIGFSTVVDASLGLFSEKVPGKAFEFVELLNLAHRPK